MLNRSLQYLYRACELVFSLGSCFQY
jgi:hypothetical protein